MCLWCDLDPRSLISTFPAERAVCTMGGMAELKLARCVYSMSKKHEQGAIIKLFLMSLVAVTLAGRSKAETEGCWGFKAFQEALN